MSPEQPIEEKSGSLIDPDDGLEVQPEMADSLSDYLASDRRGDDADEVFYGLGLE